MCILLVERAKVIQFQQNKTQDLNNKNTKTKEEIYL